MANQWFRLYGEFATDPKVQMLSESDQRRYVMVLCLRCSNGDVTLHDTEMAFQLRISNEEWVRTKDVLQSKGLVTDDNKPTAWDKRQFRSDSSAERVAAHRERKKNSSNSDVTLQERKDNALDTDTDTDIKEAKPSAPAAAKHAVLNARQMVETLPGLTVEVACDYLAFRKGKRSALTPTAWKQICREVSASGWSPDAALSEAMASGWQGVKADWLANRKNTAPGAKPAENILFLGCQ